MPFRFLEDIAVSDVAFEAWGESLEELFMAASDATINIMVEDLSTIERREKLTLEVKNPELDLLLFNLLNELVYYKDAKKLLLLIDSIIIEKIGEDYRITAIASGEPLDYKKHPLKVDVKAVTLHMLSVEKTGDVWKAIVVLDV